MGMKDQNPPKERLTKDENTNIDFYCFFVLSTSSHM